MTENEILRSLQSSGKERDKALDYLLFKAREGMILKFARLLKVDPDEIGFVDAFVEAVNSFSGNIAQYDATKSSMTSSLVRFTWERLFTSRRSEARRRDRHWWAALGKKYNLNDEPSETENGNINKWQTRQFSALENNTVSADSELLAQERNEILIKIITHFGPKCKVALYLWSLETPHKEIGEQIQEKNPRSFIQNCQKRLNNWLVAHPSIIEYFKTT